MIGIYEASGDHSWNYHPVREVTVILKREGEQVLVLSAYEPIRWVIQLANGAQLREVHLIGVHEPMLAPITGHDNISITIDANSEGACGYSWPYNGEGCDTNQVLALARKYAGGEITSFHGCYRASQWIIDSDFSAISNSVCLSGENGYSFRSDCHRLPQWTPNYFTTLETAICLGERYSYYNSKYNLWVGAILCGSASRYKLYRSERSTSQFLQIADYSGHGQDHCELVNPEFRLPDGDDITSGGCTECTMGELNLGHLPAVPLLAGHLLARHLLAVYLLADSCLQNRCLGPAKTDICSPDDRPLRIFCSLHVNLRFFNSVQFEFNTVKDLFMLGNN